MRKIFISSILIVATLNAQSYKSIKKLAYDAHKSGKYENSIKKTKEYIKSHPKSLKAKNLLAVIYYWSGDYRSSKKTLDEILSKSDYDESKRLLSFVDKKLKKAKQVSKKRSPKVSKRSTKEIVELETSKLTIKPSKYFNSKKTLSSKKIYSSLKISNQKEDIDDFERLAALINLESDDQKSKELLAKYYLKSGEYQKSYDLASEILYTDPDNKDMKTIISHLEKRDDIVKKKKHIKQRVVDLQKARYKLKTLFKKKKYTNYINLYKALKNSGERMSEKENEDALFAAIMMGDFKYAKNILSSSPLPHSRYKREVQTLLLGK